MPFSLGWTGASGSVAGVSESEVVGHRFLLTCAMIRYQHCADWNRDELAEDVDRLAQLLCGDFLPVDARYQHRDVLGDSPTSVQLLDRLRAFCTSPDRRVNDYLVVYLTGHGEILDDGDHVLLASDTRPSDLLHRTVPTADIVKRALAGTRVRRLLLLLDTCYSGRGGEDLAREALRRMDQPASASSEEAGRGIVVVAATRPYQLAVPGTFTRCLDRAVRSLATAGNVAPTLRVGALIGAINDDLDKPATQSAVWHQLGMDDDEPAFLPNPRYRPLIHVDLLEQERARQAEQSEGQLRDRFLPAILWFTGRHRALTDLAAWLRNETTPCACVVTGHAGSGKTAVLGLIAALSDSDQAPGIPKDGLSSEFTGVADSAITEAIYAGSMTTEQVRDRIAAAAGLRVKTVQELIDGLSHRSGGRIVVLVDAVDEAADPAGLISGLLNHMIHRCCGSVRLLLGTRPHMLALLGKPDSGRYQVIDLDSESYADPHSIRKYARRILLSEDSLDSAYTPSGIYRTAARSDVDAVTEAIGEAAGNSFLVARITATTEATATTLPGPADPAWRTALPRRAGEAMRRDLHLRLGEDAVKAAQLLLPLAYPQGRGLPWEDIWPRLANALSLGQNYCNDDLVWLRRAAGSYAVEGVADGRSVYRLYHRALAEHLLEGRDQTADQRVITETLLAQVPLRAGGQRDWAVAHPYSRAHLVTHAARAGRIDGLLADPGFLLAASRPQLLAGLEAADSPTSRWAADAYRRADRHLRSKPKREHASYLQLAAYCSRAPDLADALHHDIRPGHWSARWASWQHPQPHHALAGHTGPVMAVAVAELDGRPVVVSGSTDGRVRVWELDTGAPVGKPFTGHTDWVRAVAVAELAGRPVVVSGSADGTVRVWELGTGVPVGDPFTGHTGWVRAVAVVELDGRPVVVSGCDDHTVRVWELDTGVLI
ncbi:MAG: caspase family protein, partial [Pseudonocardiaceae bacterium]